MVNIRILSLATFLLLVFGCTKKEEKQISLKGDLSVLISPLSEFGSFVNDKAGIEVAVEGTTPEAKAVTDASGRCVVKDLPMGTYNLRISKEGYGTLRYCCFRFLGGDTPYRLATILRQKSTTKVVNYYLSCSNSKLTVSGTISHNYYANSTSNNPDLIAFISNKPDVSSTSYIYSDSFYSNSNNRTTFLTSVPLHPSDFPKGSTVYVVLCGENSNDYSYYYDPERRTYYKPNLGDPSEVKSIVVQ